MTYLYQALSSVAYILSIICVVEILLFSSLIFFSIEVYIVHSGSKWLNSEGGIKMTHDMTFSISTLTQQIFQNSQMVEQHKYLLPSNKYGRFQMNVCGET